MMTDEQPPPYDWSLHETEPSYLLTLWWDVMVGARNALRLVALIAGFVVALFGSAALLTLALYVLR